MKNLLYPNISNYLITVGLDEFNHFVYIDLLSLAVTKSPININDLNFNESKYLEFRKSSDLVYTVLYKVFKDSDVEDILGYVISDNIGNIQLVNLSNLHKLVKSFPCMTYYLVSKNNKSFLRQYKGETVCSIKDSDLKSIYGYSFKDLSLRETMELDEIDFCMINNGFKLGYFEPFKMREVDCYYLLYFNSVGGLCELRLYGNSLKYFNQVALMVNHVDSKSYSSYLKKNIYEGSSTTPLGGLDSDILLFSNNNVNRMMHFFNFAYTYSYPCIPYYFSNEILFENNLLFVSNRQFELLDSYATKMSLTFKIPYSSLLCFASDYIGYRNIFKYEIELQEFYSEYKEKFLDKFLEIGLKVHCLTVEQLNKMMEDLNEIV